MRTHKLAAVVAIIAAFVAAVMLTSCTANPQPSTATTLSTHSASPLPSSPETVKFPSYESTVKVDVDGATIADLRNYLNSPERSARYESLAKDAGIVVAIGLNNGVFGVTERYTEMKQPRPDDYVGWGEVTAASDYPTPEDYDNNPVNPVPSAWVYWNADGTIDTTKPVMDVYIGNKNDFDHTKVNVSDPSVASEWWGAVSYESYPSGRFVPYSTNVIENLGWGYVLYSGAYTMVSPSSLNEMKEFDNFVLERLETNMVSWFGDDWRNYR
jgi:hypothetical protein